MRSAKVMVNALSAGLHLGDPPCLARDNPDSLAFVNTRVRLSLEPYLIRNSQLRNRQNSVTLRIDP